MLNSFLKFLPSFIDGNRTLSPNVHPVNKNHIAIGGYDLVSYFTENRAIKGSSSIIDTYNGITYQFTSWENRQKFVVTPQSYLPQCDGHCAMGVVRGYKARINPKTFKVIDHKLYLFFNGLDGSATFNALALWDTNESENLKLLPEKWKKLNRRRFFSF